MPLIADLHLENDFFRQPILCGFIFAIVSFLMVSQVPTLSAKRLAIKREYALHILVIVGLLTALVATFPWLVLTILGLLYWVSIPYGAWKYRKLAEEHAATLAAADAAASGESDPAEARRREVKRDDLEPGGPPDRSALH